MNDVLESATLLETKDGIDLYFQPLVEHLPIDENLMDKSLLDETIEKVNSYEWTYFCACVYAEKNGIRLAADYLGACIYDSYEDFISSGDYIEDMKQTAYTEANEAIKALCA